MYSRLLSDQRLEILGGGILRLQTTSKGLGCHFSIKAAAKLNFKKWSEQNFYRFKKVDILRFFVLASPIFAVRNIYRTQGMLFNRTLYSVSEF